MNRSILSLLPTVVILILLSSCQTKDTINYSVANVPWPEALGNHRAILKIDNAAEAVDLNLIWRRHDKGPDQKRMLIVNAETGDTVKNILRKEVTNEKCHLVFGPVNSPGKYFFYYLSHIVQENGGFYYGGYYIPEDEPDNDWVTRCGLDDEAAFESLPKAVCSEIQSRTEFDSFYPMEIISTEEEKQTFLKNNEGEYFLFPEDRINPIRMFDNIPSKWIQNKLPQKFIGKALQNEYYVFQVGVWAAVKDLKNVTIQFSDLESRSSSIPLQSITCFNTEGYDPDGNYFQKVLDIKKNKVQAMWIGVDIPSDIKPGRYKGWLVIKPYNLNEQKIDIEINIEKEILRDRGDSELWRHSRLRWLNSTLGIDKEPVKPFSAIDFDGKNTLNLTGSSIKLGDNGLPAEIKSWGTSILSKPISLEIETLKIDAAPSKFETLSMDRSNGEVTGKYLSDNDAYTIHGQSTIEFDGYIKCEYTFTAKEEMEIEDVKLVIPMKSDLAEYMMGMDLPGTKVPENHSAKWNGPHDSFWIGNTYGGIFCELRGSDYHGPLLNLYKPDPPRSWYNDNKGGFLISRSGKTVFATVTSGERTLKKGEQISFEFSLIITPVRQVNTQSQFTDRYFHNGLDPVPDDEELSAGVKIINLHHANQYNPHINYPFIATEEMRGFVDRFHSKGVKVKIYYTIRELTNWVTEIWALRSLGDEILGGGKGGGFPWLREHLVDNYTPQWYERLTNEKVDASILTSTGESRWFNYYIEGLGWLVENMDIDGLYLDDVSYDRKMVKRMRKVMEMHKPGCILDLHSNTGFSKGPATQYTDFFPYINKLWFGESFLYDQMPPENWLVEVSGIPFGLMGDMLHGGGNPWRGMVYGMTVRYPWYTEGVNCNPREIWKIWDSFDIASSEMIGYWDKRSVIKTSNPDVLLTYYVKPDKILISLASWSDTKVDVKIISDWESLGYDPDKITLTAPVIEKFQPAASYSLSDKIPVEPKKGWILMLNR